jgi:putative transferase (TIGR04331 family)
MFLTTTALDEFLIENNNTVFLGEWCKKYDTKRDDNLVISFLWDKAYKCDTASARCWKVYDIILPLIASSLNQVHGVKKSHKYWELIIGNWLFTFINVIYDRYYTLDSFIHSYPEFDTILLSKDCYVVPVEYDDFISKVCDDGYNLQLYSQILRFLGYEFESKEYIVGQKDSYVADNKKVKRDIFFKIMSLFGAKPAVTVTAPYFSAGISSYFKLFWESRGTVIFDDFSDSFSIDMQIDRQARESLSDLAKGSDDVFLRLVVSLLPQNFPMLFLEGYHAMRDVAISRDKPKTKLYATANALHGNYLYKFWMAEYSNEIKLVSVQHGGGYGIDFLNSPEIYERRIVDRFLTWGWKESEKTIPSTHEKLNMKNSQKHKAYILYVAKAGMRYMVRFQSSYNSSANNLDYKHTVISFFECVGDVKRFLFRGYPRDYGFGVNQKIIAHFPDMTVDDHSESFHDRLKKARLFVCDHMHTTYLETLAVNFPTVIFVDSNYYSFRRPEIVQRLVDAKILWYDEKKAAEHINAIYDDIDSWWMSEEVQSAREEFCYHYARASDNWARDWVNAFKNILEEDARTVF